jgi:hypothetical protein
VTYRTIRNAGGADYSPIEDEMVRRLLAKDAHGEVLLVHTMKVALDARPVEADESWFPERRAVEPRQEVLL